MTGSADCQMDLCNMQINVWRAFKMDDPTKGLENQIIRGKTESFDIWQTGWHLVQRLGTIYLIVISHSIGKQNYKSTIFNVNIYK